VDEGEIVAPTMKTRLKDGNNRRAILCFVNGKKCASQNVFNELTKIYTEQ
jgi:hypothetical protein